MVKNSPCKAGDEGSSPAQGTKSPHAEGQPSSHTTTAEPAHHNERGRRTEQRSHVPQLRPDTAK